MCEAFFPGRIFEKLTLVLGQKPYPLVHFNVKAQNIYLCSLRHNSPVVAKLSEFGDTRPARQLTEEFYVSDPTYVAPEILLGKLHDEKGLFPSLPFFWI